MDAELTLLQIRLDDFSKRTIQRIARLRGFTQNVRIERKGIMAVNDFLRNAQAAYRSKVPYATGELRSQISVRPASITPFNGTGEVYIPATVHYASFSAQRPTNSGLARLLDGIQQRRSRTSVPVPPFSAAVNSTSEGWIDEAFQEFSLWASQELQE